MNSNIPEGRYGYLKGGAFNLCRRRVQKNKISKSVILPKVWTDNNNIEAGDEVEFTLLEDGSLLVSKVGHGRSDGMPAAGMQGV